MSTKARPKYDERRIGALAKRAEAKEEPLSSDPVALLVHSALLENSSRHAADLALQRIRDRTVDLNEYRVCIPQEASVILGARTPKAVDRAIAIRRMLYDIFRRNHGLHLDHLKEASKRDIRAALDTLDGVSPFVAARVALLSYEVHVMPVDQSMHDALVSVGFIDQEMTLPELAGHMERHFRGDAIRAAHLALQEWCDTEGVKRSAKPSKPASKKGTKPAASTRKTRATPRKSAATKASRAR
ncbi:MAG: hypothetical protein O2819_09450 [Planctomycetota bacterium]|nr:hypothetical protein [Planctomycetota bacterium]MDA1106529.1 hypothetical protein [Planctomycetota bacterium]